MKYLLFSISLALLLLGCGEKSDKKKEEAIFAAKPYGDSECGTCSMIVREQPSPRGQAIHRDGTRKFFCSIGDLIQYLAIPSPHGKIRRVYVELMNVDHAKEKMDYSQHPWKEAKLASYVLGVERDGIMGEPIMVYSSLEEAQKTAAYYKAKTYNWADLQKQILGR